jgi:pimeloyl-ACP methyl ester carboxylesterase
MDGYLESSFTAPDGTPLWYQRFEGEEPALVLCDGIGCDGYVWQHLIPHLQGRVRMIHWHYRGHGRSGTPADLSHLGVEECAQDLWGVVEHAGVRGPAVLAGHSMGVQVILEAWHQRPRLVRALIPVTGSYGKAIDHVHDSSLVRHLFPLLRSLAPSLMPLLRPAWRELVRSELAYWYACTFEINAGLVRREDFFPYLDHLSRMDPEVFLRTLEGAARHTAEPYLADIRVPTLVVASERDRFTPYWISQRMHALIPGSELLSLPMGSHTGPIELPELFNLRVEKFLEGLPAA